MRSTHDSRSSLCLTILLAGGLLFSCGGEAGGPAGPAVEVPPPAAAEPDGRLLFLRSTRGEPDALVLIREDSAGEVVLSGADWHPARPVWSPDGRRIAFHSDRGGLDDVWVVDLAGGEPVNVSNDPQFAGDAAWSPDGDHIAFMSGKRNLTRNPASDTLPAWSPDGSRIAFISDRVTLTEVFVMGPGSPLSPIAMARRRSTS